MWSEGRRRLAGAVLGLALLGSSLPVGAQVYRSAEERFFRIEWHVERAGGRDAAIVGVLDNPYLFRLQRVQLQVQVLDASGHAVREATAPMTDVPAGGRGSFRLPLPDAGARYVVTVHAFEFGSGESP